MKSLAKIAITNTTMTQVTKPPKYNFEREMDAMSSYEEAEPYYYDDEIEYRETKAKKLWRLANGF